MNPPSMIELDADVLHEVVVDAAAALDRGDDGGEVVVGEDHVAGFLGHLRAGDAHRDADVGALERRGVVDPVAGHRDDVALRLSTSTRRTLSSGATRATTPMLSTSRSSSLVAQRRELGARERTALDSELRRDRGRGRRVVAGDHAHADARRPCSSAMASRASLRGGSTMPTSASSVSPCT